MTDIEDMFTGPVTITAVEKERMEKVTQAMTMHREAVGETGLNLMMDPETRDLFYLVVICGLKAIDKGMIKHEELKT